MDAERLKFFYQDLPEDGAFITAQLEGNEAVNSVILVRARNPLSHEAGRKSFPRRAFEKVATFQRYGGQ